MAADSQGGSNKIVLPAGTFTLTLAGGGEGNDATGDLDIKANVSIQGRGAGSTIIDGDNLDRVIEVLGGTVSITGVTIQHGRVVGDGGGIFNSGGRLSLNSVVVANNVAIGGPVSVQGGRGGGGRRLSNGGNGRGRRNLQRGGVAQPGEDHDRVQPGDRRRRRGGRGARDTVTGKPAVRRRRRRRRRRRDLQRGRRHADR